MITLFVPCDSAALAAGADEVVDALHKEATARGTAIDVQRNSSRGPRSRNTILFLFRRQRHRTAQPCIRQRAAADIRGVRRVCRGTRRQPAHVA